MNKSHIFQTMLRSPAASSTYVKIGVFSTWKGCGGLLEGMKTPWPFLPHLFFTEFCL